MGKHHKKEKIRSLDLKNIGLREYCKIPEKDRDLLGKDSCNLVFKKLLLLESVRDDRPVGDTTLPSWKRVGVEFLTKISLPVPSIPAKYTSVTGVPSELVEWNKVPANSLIRLTYLETMYLLSQHRFMGYCTREFVNGEENPKGVYLSLRKTKYEDGSNKLPTPMLIFSEDGSPKEFFDFVDEKNEEGEWIIKKEYKKFEDCLQKIYPPKVEKIKLYQPENTALTLQTLLSISGDVEC